MARIVDPRDGTGNAGLLAVAVSAGDLDSSRRPTPPLATTQDAFGWRTERAGPADANRLPVTDLPVERNLAGLLSTVPGAHPGPMALRIDGVVISSAGDFSMTVENTPRTPRIPKAGSR